MMLSSKKDPLAGQAEYLSVRTRNLFDPASRESYKLSRSKLELFLQCPRCFYLDRRLGINRPDGPSPTLNLAVDLLMKREFDLYRGRGEAHEHMIRQGIDAVPLRHPALNEWRDAMRGIRYLHSQTNFLVFGAIDDVWVNPAGQMNVVDYKAMSSSAGGPIQGVSNESYRRQLEVYQWLLRQNGFDVSDTAYFVYVNAERGRESFDGRLEFTTHIIAYEGDTDWIDDALLEAHKCLLQNSLPVPSRDCEWCRYRKATRQSESW